MRIFTHGTDKGNAILTALVFIMVLSTLIVTFIPRITVITRFARQYKAHVYQEIEQSNREAMIRYDSY
jgi:type II secretory pathway component PulK